VKLLPESSKFDHKNSSWGEKTSNPSFGSENDDQRALA